MFVLGLASTFASENIKGRRKASPRAKQQLSVHYNPGKHMPLLADSVVWVRVARPAVFIIASFQAGILEATLSTKRCSSTRFSLDNDNGAPKYVHGNCCSWQGNTYWTSATSSSEHRIGVILHLSRLVWSPDAPAKTSKISLMQMKSSAHGTRKITISSA